MKLIDIHTHSLKDDKSILSIISYRIGQKIEDNLYSFGIHPWYINPTGIDKDIENVIEVTKSERCVAVGECGLDGLAEAELEIQKKVFSLQIEISERIQKPLILHCVKAFPEIVSFRKRHKPKMPWIVHGFRKNYEIAKSLFENGIYLSFGDAILKDKNIHQILTKVPKDFIFFETDESPIGIYTIYQRASELLQCSLEELKSYIYNNFQKVFFSC